MKGLLSSFAEVIKRIKVTGAVWVQAPNGLWYHEYKQSIVLQRIEDIKTAMRAISDHQEARDNE